MNNYPADFYTMNTGVQGHTEECDSQPEGMKCICDETIDIGNLDEIDVVDVKMPSKRFSDPFKGEPR